MTSPRTLLLYLSHFWPEISPTQIAATHILEALVNQGWEARVFAPRHDVTWPAEISFRGTTVHRVHWPMRGPWRMRRYYRQLGIEIDACLATTGNATPLIVTFDRSEDLGALRRATDKCGARLIAVVNRELHPQFASRRPLPKTWIRRLNFADEMIACCPAIHDWLVGQGALTTPVKFLPTVVLNEGDMVSALDRNAVRKTLSRLHPLLDVEPNQPVALAFPSFDGDPGIDDVLVAWSSIVRSAPRARLWLIGEGPDWRRVARRVADMGLDRSICLPGAFDCWFDVALAANVYLHGSRWPGDCLGLKSALATGCPAVVTQAWEWRVVPRFPTAESPPTFQYSSGSALQGGWLRSELEETIDNEPVVRVPIGDPAAMAKSVVNLFHDPSNATALGTQAAHWIAEHWPTDLVAAAWHQTIENSSCTLPIAPK